MEFISSIQRVYKSSPYLVLGAICLLLIFSVFNFSFILAIGLILLNAILEMHKLYTKGIPIDVEILTLGTAYLAASGNIIPAALVAILGPGVAELFRGHICTGTWFRPIPLLIIIPVAMALGPAKWQLFIAVVVGVVANFFRVLLTAPNSDPIMSFISRSTQLLFTAHIIFFMF